MRKIVFLFLMIPLVAHAAEKHQTRKLITITTEDIAFIDLLGNKNRERFDENWGQFQILIPKNRFIFSAPNCKKNVILRMVGTDPDEKNSNIPLDYHWGLLKAFQAVSEGKLDKLTVRVDVSPYFKKTKNGEIILKYCNAFIPADFWKYSLDNNESNTLEKPVEQQNAPLEFENK